MELDELKKGDMIMFIYGDFSGTPKANQIVIITENEPEKKQLCYILPPLKRYNYWTEVESKSYGSYSFYDWVYLKEDV